jgi:O-methyltransferase involved in polyketide biosynthesis
MPSTPVVTDVSDTARWVAVYRAWESARPDALFHDPFADRLAGERGRAMAAAVPRPAGRAWPMAVGTRLIDDLVKPRWRRGAIG